MAPGIQVKKQVPGRRIPRTGRCRPEDDLRLLPRIPATIEYSISCAVVKKKTRTDEDARQVADKAMAMRSAEEVERFLQTETRRVTPELAQPDEALQ